MPPTTANEDFTDEDSGEDDNVSPNNLPGSQHRSDAELFHHSIPDAEEGENETRIVEENERPAKSNDVQEKKSAKKNN